MSLRAPTVERLSLHRSSFLWAAWCFSAALGVIGGLLLVRGATISGDTVDLVVGSILAPLFLVLGWFCLLDTRATVVVSREEVRLRRGPLGWWRVPTDEVVYVELLQPLVHSQSPLGLVTFGWPARWRLAVWRVDGTAIVANRYGLPPDPREGWGPVDLIKVVEAVQSAQGPAGRFGLPGPATRRLIEGFPARARWPSTPFQAT